MGVICVSNLLDERKMTGRAMYEKFRLYRAITFSYHHHIVLKGYESLTVVDKSREHQFNDHSGILSVPNPDVCHVCSVVVVFVVVALGNVCIIYLGGTGWVVRRRLGVTLMHPSSR